MTKHLFIVLEHVYMAWTHVADMFVVNIEFVI